MSTEKPRFTITVTEEMLSDIAQYQMSHHLATRSGAIQELISIGIRELISQGIIEKAPPKEDEALLDLFHQLNAEGKQKLLDYADDLVESGKYIKTVVGELA